MRSGIGATLAIAAASLLAASPAIAAKDPLEGGKTTIEPSKRVAKALSKAGVRVKPIGRAKSSSSGFKFPVSGGELISGEAEGTIRHKGGLRLQRAKDKTNFKNPVVELGKTNVVRVAAVTSGNKKKTKLFKLKLKQAKIVRKEFATKITNVKAKLTTATANLLRADYGLKFKSGDTFGTVEVLAEPASVALQFEGETTLAFDPLVLEPLLSAGYSIYPFFGATAESNEFVFPITGGRLSPHDPTGIINHLGALDIFSPPGGGIGIIVRLANLKLNADADRVTALVSTTVVSSGGDTTVRGGRFPILALDLSGATFEADGLLIRAGGIKASGTQAAADWLDGAFSVPDFSDDVGVTLADLRVEAVAR